MPFYFFHWDDELVEYIDLHGITTADFESVVMNASQEQLDFSRSTGKDIAFGSTADGRHIVCIFEWLDDFTIIPITAYEVE
jgi:uncharacterized DUF497 family protein